METINCTLYGKPGYEDVPRPDLSPPGKSACYFLCTEQKGGSLAAVCGERTYRHSFLCPPERCLALTGLDLDPVRPKPQVFHVYARLFPDKDHQHRDFGKQTS